MSPKVGGVRVNVDTAVAGDLWLACRYPFAVDILPAVTVGRDEVQQKGVHSIGVQSCDTDLQNREHPPERNSHEGISEVLFPSQPQTLLTSDTGI